jgi:hypothetical protein
MGMDRWYVNKEQKRGEWRLPLIGFFRTNEHMPAEFFQVADCVASHKTLFDFDAQNFSSEIFSLRHLLLSGIP